MQTKILLSRHVMILIAVAAAGLFAAGFGYGYEAPSFDVGFDDPGLRVGSHGAFPVNF